VSVPPAGEPRARGLRPALVGLALLVAGAPPAFAHPHIWINSVTTFHFEAGRLTGLELEWAFDEFFGEWVVQDFDLDGDGVLDAEEQARLYEEAFVGLAEFDFLTHIRIDGEKLRVTAVEGFEAVIEDGVLVYRFTVPFAEPIDPGRQRVSTSLYDETFFIDVMLDGADPVRFEGVADGACHFAVREDAGNAIYFGLVYPLVIDLDCTGS
jgi:ABC-type uncharacterized transport system substrate-binding protein